MIKFCKTCLFPDTKPDLFLNQLGICDACVSAEQKWNFEEGIDWREREDKFKAIISELGDQNLYDCIVPVSGGKDSTWQAYSLKNTHGLKPLAVTFDQFDTTEIGRKNLELIKSFGIDHIHFTLNPNIVKKLVYRGFVEVGDPYWVNHVGMFSVPHTIAKNFSIPLIVYGENPQFEYGGPEESRAPKQMDARWRQEFGGLRGLREEDMVDDEINWRDVEVLKFPINEDGKPLAKAIFYGDYFRWDPNKHTNFVKKLGWSELIEVPAGSFSKIENCDMKFIDVREHIKFLKFGYGRATDQLNIEIRSNNMAREEALQLALELDGKISNENKVEFCKYLDIDLAEFDRVIDDFVNRDIFEKTNSGWNYKVERT